MEYHGKFGHNLVRIQKIDIMINNDMFYTDCRLITQTVAPNIPGFQCFKRYIQYIASYFNKTVFVLLIHIMYQMSSYLHGLGLKLNTTQPIMV